MKRMLLLPFLSLAVSLVAAEGPYDFRTSDVYRKLPAADKQRLEQVHRDLVLVWGALDMYADEHKGKLPVTLDELVPRFLAELPSDPFATQETASVQTTQGHTIQERHGIPFQEGLPAIVRGSFRVLDWRIFHTLQNAGTLVFTSAKGLGFPARICSDNHQMRVNKIIATIGALFTPRRDSSWHRSSIATMGNSPAPSRLPSCSLSHLRSRVGA